jgi:hypothetical protein
VLFAPLTSSDPELRGENKKNKEGMEERSNGQGLRFAIPNRGCLIGSDFQAMNIMGWG